MGNIRQSKPKKANIEKLNLYLKLNKNGKQEDKRTNTKGRNDSK